MLERTVVCTMGRLMGEDKDQMIMRDVRLILCILYLRAFVKL